MVVYVAEDNLVAVSSLTNNQTGAFVNSASITGVVKDDAGATVVSGISFSYVAASNGDYEAIINDNAPLVAGRTYVLEITGSSGQSNLFRRIRLQAVHHGAE